MCFLPQRRAPFEHLIFQQHPEHVNDFLDFCLLLCIESHQGSIYVLDKLCSHRNRDSLSLPTEPILLTIWIVVLKSGISLFLLTTMGEEKPRNRSYCMTLPTEPPGLIAAPLMPGISKLPGIAGLFVDQTLLALQCCLALRLPAVIHPNIQGSYIPILHW